LRAFPDAGTTFDAELILDIGLSISHAYSLDRAYSYTAIAILTIGGYGIYDISVFFLHAFLPFQAKYIIAFIW
jgi:hypothetical protein